MKARNRQLNLIFGLAGGLLFAVILLPLAALLAANSPVSLLAALSDREFLSALVITFEAAALATLIALLGGVPLAYLLARRRFWGKGLVEALLDLPVVVPHTAAGVALLLVFGARGILGAPLAELGLFFTDHLAGIVVAMLFVSLPYLVNLSRESFALVDVELESIALVEGATPWQAFQHVTLPIAWRGVVAGALMMWARGISEFGAVVILAYHPKTVTTLIFERFEGFGLQAALPAAALMILIVLAVFSLLRWLLFAGREN
jgi:molybdate/tungstate transport system permease protein